MFRCDRCNSVVPPSTRETKIVVETREKVYEARGGMTRDFPRSRRPIGRRTRRAQAFDKGGTGHEIVREISVCPKCAESHKAEQAAAAAEAAAIATEVATPAAV
ncbi:MAG: hypothetical protein ACK5Q5_21585 [Planctomycetaceae bacterium]